MVWSTLSQIFYEFLILDNSFHEPPYKRNNSKICDALRDLIPFVQFKKREKRPWMSNTFSKVAD